MCDYQDTEADGDHVEITDVPKESVIITISKEDKYCLATCDYFEDWAQGKTYWEALWNLMGSLEVKYKTLRKENLGKAATRILERFEKGGSD